MAVVRVSAMTVASGYLCRRHSHHQSKWNPSLRWPYGFGKQGLFRTRFLVYTKHKSMHGHASSLLIPEFSHERAARIERPLCAAQSALPPDNSPCEYACVCVRARVSVTIKSGAKLENATTIDERFKLSPRAQPFRCTRLRARQTRSTSVPAPMTRRSFAPASARSIAAPPRTRSNLQRCRTQRGANAEPGPWLMRAAGASAGD